MIQKKCKYVKECYLDLKQNELHFIKKKNNKQLTKHSRPTSQTGLDAHLQ